MIITINKTAKYENRICVQKSNRNYFQLNKINDCLLKNKLSWEWLINYTGIPISTIKIYLRGHEFISLKSTELISIALSDFIKSPKELMNPECPVLRLGDDFELNILQLCNKYQVTNRELILECKIDKSNITLIRQGKLKELRVQKLLRIYNYFVSIDIPLKSPLDLIYFPHWKETPLGFLRYRRRKKGVYRVYI